MIIWIFSELKKFFEASIAMEIIDQVGDKCDSVFLSVGGGGLATAVAYAIGNLKPDIEGELESYRLLMGRVCKQGKKSEKKKFWILFLIKIFF